MSTDHQVMSQTRHCQSSGDVDGQKARRTSPNLGRRHPRSRHRLSPTQGRPPKVRSAEELAEFERRKEERALGIKRKSGRPRKYPELGLVREMRLKKNRAGVQEKIRMLEERQNSKAVEHESWRA
jgi:hypothetical protein